MEVFQSQPRRHKVLLAKNQESTRIVISYDKWQQILDFVKANPRYHKVLGYLPTEHTTPCQVSTRDTMRLAQILQSPEYPKPPEDESDISRLAEFLEKSGGIYAQQIELNLLPGEYPSSYFSQEISDVLNALATGITETGMDEILDELDTDDILLGIRTQC